MKTILNYVFCCLLNSWVLGWQSLLKYRIPPFADLLCVPCPISITIGSTIWPGHVPCVCHHTDAIEEEISLTLCIQNLPTHTPELYQVFAVTPMSWSAPIHTWCHWWLFHGLFYWGVCSQNKQCCFPRGWMCEWQWDKDMETLNRKSFGLSGNVCCFICFQVAQYPRLLFRCCVMCCNWWRTVPEVLVSGMTTVGC